MRNTDKFNYVCFTNGGNGSNGKQFAAKMRLTNDRTRYTKVLNKIGVTSMEWVDLPHTMSKAEVITYLRAEHSNIDIRTEYEDAINNTESRLLAKKTP